MVFMVGLRGGFGWGCVRALMFFEAGEVGCFIIFGAVFPAGVDNANPFESQCTNRCVVSRSLLFLSFNKLLGPAACQLQGQVAHDRRCRDQPVADRAQDPVVVWRSRRRDIAPLRKVGRRLDAARLPAR